MRPTKDEYYLTIALAVGLRSTCLKKRYGAVIVKDDRIVSTGYNGAPKGEPNCCDCGSCYKDLARLPVDPGAARHLEQYGSCVAVHAEQNAIIKADPRDLEGAVMYLSCSETDDPTPCNICDRMIRNAGIRKLITLKGTKVYGW